MDKEFTHKDQLYFAVGIERMTRWTSACMDCGNEYTFQTLGEFVKPAYPIRRCVKCRRERRRKITERKKREAVEKAHRERERER